MNLFSVVPWLRFGQRTYPRQGFTLIELLTVVAVIGLLASLTFPALAKAMVKVQSVQCLSHMRQLTLGWLLYADDHEGKLCPNGVGPRQGWVDGILSFDNNTTDNTNLVFLTNPQYAKLAPYAPSPSLYHCPADKSVAYIEGRKYPRVRSLAMNHALGSNADGQWLPTYAHWRVYRKLSDASSPGPANLWVLIEQHSDSIDDGRFGVDCQDQNERGRWIDYPASLHDRQCSVSFVDGHVEMHRWQEALTMPPVRSCGCLAHYVAQGYFEQCPNSRDLAWLQEHTSARSD